MKLSQTISDLLVEYTDKPLPLSALLQNTGTNGFGIVAGMFTIPMLIPSPIPVAGFSTVVGSGIILMGCQLLLGYDQPYLPSWITRRELSAGFSQKLLQGLQRLLSPLERLSYQRFSRFSSSGWGLRVIGFCLAWDAVLMSLPLPIPLTNLLPAYTILVLVIGLLESDGLFILLGYGMTTVTTLFFVSIAGTIWQLATYWFHLLMKTQG